MIFRQSLLARPSLKKSGSWSKEEGISPALRGVGERSSAMVETEEMFAGGDAFDGSLDANDG